MGDLLVVDIGNSTIKLGVKRKGWFLKRIPLGNRCIELTMEAIKEFKTREAVVSTVVPEVGDEVAGLLESAGMEVYRVSHRDTGGLLLGVKYPEKMGTDRISNAVASYELVRSDVIAIDVGTAITTTLVVDRRILGGNIMPGIEMMSRALEAFTSRLPRVEVVQPEGPFGHDTQSSIISGIIYGTSGALERLYEEISREVGEVAVVVTGGGAPLLKGYLRIPYLYEPFLTMEGLRLMYERRKDE